jgi:hypothetical protein
MANSKEITKASPLHHLQMPVRTGLIGETRQRDGDLRRNAKSFARFHRQISLEE